MTANFGRSQAAKRQRAREVYAILTATYPNVHCTLDYKNPFQLLVMTILAAQCTDARVNIVARDLFKRYRKPGDFIGVPAKDIEAIVHSAGFFRQKTKSILRTAALLAKKHGGKVPDTIEELIALPGVGRKTANVILGECYGKQGVIVDTHCTRLTNRLGFTKNTGAVKIEEDLMKLWPEDCWTLFSHLMVFHGREVCAARAPRCSACTLRAHCPFPTTHEGKRIAK